MDADSVSEKGVGDPPSTTKAFWFPHNVRDVREEFSRLIQEMSAKSAPNIADRLQLAYYQNVLKLYETLSPDVRVHAGFGMGGHVSRHPKEVRKINQILDYLSPEGGKVKTGLRAGSISVALPASARRKKGRPVTRRPTALRALQMKIDTGKSWPAITKEVCDCTKKKHDQSCREATRQSVISLQRLLRQLGIELPGNPRIRV